VGIDSGDSSLYPTTPNFSRCSGCNDGGDRQTKLSKSAWGESIPEISLTCAPEATVRDYTSVPVGFGEHPTFDKIGCSLLELPPEWWMLKQQYIH